jgi:hypothetical protein
MNKKIVSGIPCVVLSDNDTFSDIKDCKIVFARARDLDEANECGRAYPLLGKGEEISLAELVRFWQENHK